MALVFILAASVVAGSLSAGDGVLLGFTAAGSKEQRELERIKTELSKTMKK